MDEFILMDEMTSIDMHPGESFESFDYTEKDKNVLRELAEKKLEIASLPEQQEKINLWKALNGLKDQRPMVWINEIPWHEMNVDNELDVITSSEFTQMLEKKLRKTIYRWKHIPVDMVVEPIIPCYFEIVNSGFGISEKVKISKTDETSDIVSREFTPQINSEEDIDKIRLPSIVLKKAETEEKFQAMQEIFDGILEVKKMGYPGFWFSPWDELIRWYSVEKMFNDLILNPGLIHKAMERLTEAHLGQLDEYEKLGLLALNNGNYRIGSGGLGYTDELPGPDFNPSKIRAKNLWGNGAAQIFSGVSPEMHQEFALNYEKKWMERFGLVYYGCCEPLDKKIDILRTIPNLRKISMSPWTNLRLGAENIGREYVFSYKPSPSIFASDYWDMEKVKKDLKEDLNKIEKCPVEIIMKDISTVRREPKRLWEWANAAMEVVLQHHL